MAERILPQQGHSAIYNEWHLWPTLSFTDSQRYYWESRKRWFLSDFCTKTTTWKIKISDSENELKMMKFRIFRYWLRTKGFCSARGETILTFRDIESETSGQLSKKLKNIGMRNIKIKRTMLVTILRRGWKTSFFRPSLSPIRQRFYSYFIFFHSGTSPKAVELRDLWSRQRFNIVYRIFLVRTGWN